MLSLGQKKRVAIAGALAMTPKVLVLDEPTAGLDPHGTVHLLAALRRLTASGTTIVYATHDVDLACAWSDRVALFSDGRVFAEGAPEAILGDAELMRSARLRRPMTLEVGQVARELGLIGASEPLPRTAAEVVQVLRDLVDAQRETACAPAGQIEPVRVG